jgi:hypothetical protein
VEEGQAVRVSRQAGDRRRRVGDAAAPHFIINHCIVIFRRLFPPTPASLALM